MLLVASVALTFLPQGTAQAHYEPRQNQRYTYWSSNFCVLGWGEQNHQYSLWRTYTRTSSGGIACAAYLNRNPGYIRNAAAWYKQPYLGHPGTICFGEPEQWNTTYSYYLNRAYLQDAWHRNCNYGAGVHVVITMDTWNWAAYGYYWYPDFFGPASGIRPITYHCHCP